MTELNAEEIRSLPLPDLALKVLAQWAGFGNLHTLAGWMRQSAFTDESDIDVLQNRVADAWAWLQAHALLASDPRDAGPSQRVSELGAELIRDPKAVSKIWAAERLAGELHPALGSARSNFALGDFETAAFAAMKAVEVEVRRVANLPNELLGVNLMRKAFSPKDGVLRDPAAEGGEQQATADLFAGAIGAYKNPASHRTIQFDDPVEASEVIQLADLLLRILHRSGTRA